MEMIGHEAVSIKVKLISLFSFSYIFKKAAIIGLNGIDFLPVITAAQDVVKAIFLL